jgi:hypothetical protein
MIGSFGNYFQRYGSPSYPLASMGLRIQSFGGRGREGGREGEEGEVSEWCGILGIFKKSLLISKPVDDSIFNFKLQIQTLNEG